MCLIFKEDFKEKEREAMFALGFVCQVFDELFKRKRGRKIGEGENGKVVGDE